MQLEDITINELIRDVSLTMRRDGYDVFTTKDLPEDEEDAYRMREEYPGSESAFLTVVNDRQHSREGDHLFLSFPIRKIMRSARRIENGVRDGFLLAVRAERRLTNALLICTHMGLSNFQLGLFGKKFMFIEDELVSQWEEKHKESWYIR